jgi:hypothetical protein
MVAYHVFLHQPRTCTVLRTILGTVVIPWIVIMYAPFSLLSGRSYSVDRQVLTQSPPNHNLNNPALKGHLRPSHIRARVAASPYPRDTDSVHSSSSETEDISMYLSNPGPEYHAMFGPGPSMAPTQEAMHATGAFGRMTLSSDHALEKLAANVRAATTTSASDRAKQIFVQAWYALCLICSAVPSYSINIQADRELCSLS